MATRPNAEAEANCPRETFLQDFNLAFANGNSDFLVAHVSEDVVWRIHGDRTHDGRAAFAAAVHAMREYLNYEFEIRSIVSRGRDAALIGMLTSGGKEYAFCDVYQFKDSAANLITSIDSYVIQVRSTTT